MIVSPDDIQVYELNTGIMKVNPLLIQKDISYFHELLAFASLDLAETGEWASTNMHMKTIDKFNEYYIYCMVTPGSNNIINLGMRFIFVHEGKSEDTIKSFLNDSYEFYVKVILVFNFRH